jgi:hypothetical protein
MVVTFGLALLAGLFVYALLQPWGGCVDSDPRVCTGMFGWYTVPTDAWVWWFSLVAGAAIVVVGLALWLRDRRSTR